MNKKDLDRFSRVEQQIIEQGTTHQISQLNKLPYKSLEELKFAHKYGDISFGCNYNGEFLKVVGTHRENVAHAIWISLPIIIAVVDIVLAIVFKKWILLLGVLFAILGFISSSPLSPLQKPISVLSSLLFIASFFLFDWEWIVIIGSLLFAQIFSMTAREQYRTVVEERALQSEVFFCYMFKNKYILVKDNKTNSIFDAE